MEPTAASRDSADWVLPRLSRPESITPAQALVIIGTIIVSIALADYFSESRVSLTVFYFVPILLAVAWLGIRTAVAVAVASIAFKVIGDVLEMGELSLPLWGWWNAASTLVVLLLVIWVFGSLLAVYRQLEARAAERAREIVELSEHRRLLERELLTVSSNERNVMGQELHDDICQHLVGTALAAKVLTQRLEQRDDALSGDAQSIVGLIETGIGKTRQLAKGLLLSEIAPPQLPERLAELAEEASTAGIACRFRSSGEVLVDSAATASQLYRIAQEAVRNALRHAHATRVDIALSGDGGTVSLTVEDNGRGLVEDRPNSGMGLPIMSHRAAYIGASLRLQPTAAGGTRMACTLAAPA